MPKGWEERGLAVLSSCTGFERGRAGVERRAEWARVWPGGKGRVGDRSVNIVAPVSGSRFAERTLRRTIRSNRWLVRDNLNYF